MVTYRNRDPEPSVRFRPPHPVLKVLVVLFFCVQLLAVPAFAYTSESFVVDTDPYLFKSLRSEAPALMAVDSVAALAATNEVEIFDYFQNGTFPQSLKMSVNGIIPGYVIPGVGTEIPDVPYYDPFSASFNYTGVYNTSYLFFYYNSVTIPSVDSDVDFSYISVPDWGTVYDISLDLSSLGTFSAFELGGKFAFRAHTYPGFAGTSWPSSRCDLYVNGNLLKTFTGPVFDTGGYLYNGSEPVTDITFSFYFAPADCVRITDSSYLGTVTSPRMSLVDLGSFSLSVLEDTAILNGFNDKAQSDLNDFTSTEQQYQSNMQQNWEALQLGDFQFSDTFDSSFALISGIFSDLWLAIGDFNMIYMIPLTIGLVSVVIGRTSKSRSGSSGSPVSDSTDLVVRR